VKTKNAYSQNNLNYGVGVTLKTIIHKATKELTDSGSLTASLDVKIILEHVLDKDDIYLIAHNQEIISNAQYQKFRRLIRRRKKGEPIAYIVGHKEFYGLDFAVNKNVLIPRPETEILVEKSLDFIGQKPKVKSSQSKINVIDLGTGSGCIIISLIKSLPNNILYDSSSVLQFYACDISEKALKVAKDNAKNKEIFNSIRFLKSNLMSNKRLPKKFDLIIANLPYLTKRRSKTYYTLPEHKGLEFEPETALYSNNKGFELIERLVKELSERLTKNGIALLEIDESQITKIHALCSKLKLNIRTIKNNSQYKGFVRISM
jgi:release factor glutamine methyltransferase